MVFNLLFTKIKKFVCINKLITINNPIKACFSFNRYVISIQTHMTQIVLYFILKKETVLIGFVMVKGKQNQLPINFGTD